MPYDSYGRYDSDYDYPRYSRYSSNQSSSKRSRYNEKETNEKISKTIIFKPNLKIKPSLDSTNINTSEKKITFKPYMIDNAVKSNYIFLDERIKLGKNGNKSYEFKKYYNNVKKNKFTLINILTSSTIYLDFIKWLLTTYKKNLQDVFIDKPKENDKKSSSDLDMCNEYFSDLLNQTEQYSEIQLEWQRAANTVANKVLNKKNLKLPVSELYIKIQNIIKQYIKDKNLDIYLNIINSLIKYSTKLIQYNKLKKQNETNDETKQKQKVIREERKKLINFIKPNILVNDEINYLLKYFSDTSFLDIDIKTLQKKSKDLFKEIIDMIKKYKLVLYIENLIKNYKDSIKIYTDIFLKQESILTYEKVKYTIIETKTSIADQDKKIESHIKSINKPDTSKISFIDKNITLTLIPEKDDQWKSYSGDCKTQRTRINNIFNALFKNTTNAIGISFGTDINVFTRSSTDEDAWDKIYKQININPVDKNKNDLETLRKNRSRLIDSTEKLYYKLKQDIDRLSNKQDNTKEQEKFLRDLLRDIRKTREETKEELRNIENARSRFKIDDKQIYTKQINIYILEKNYYKSQNEELDKIMDKTDKNDKTDKKKDK